MLARVAGALGVCRFSGCIYNQLWASLSDSFTCILFSFFLIYERVQRAEESRSRSEAACIIIIAYTRDKALSRTPLLPVLTRTQEEFGDQDVVLKRSSAWKASPPEYWESQMTLWRLRRSSSGSWPASVVGYVRAGNPDRDGC